MQLKKNPKINVKSMGRQLLQLITEKGRDFDIAYTSLLETCGMK